MPSPGILDLLLCPPRSLWPVRFVASVDFPIKFAIEGPIRPPGTQCGVKLSFRRAVAAYSEFGIHHPGCQAIGFASCSD
jgi:hypothetical protein